MKHNTVQKRWETESLHFQSRVRQQAEYQLILDKVSCTHEAPSTSHLLSQTPETQTFTKVSEIQDFNFPFLGNQTESEMDLPKRGC